VRFLRLSPSRFHAWRRRRDACALDDRSSCPHTSAVRSRHSTPRGYWGAPADVRWCACAAVTTTRVGRRKLSVQTARSRRRRVGERPNARHGGAPDQGTCEQPASGGSQGYRQSHGSRRPPTVWHSQSRCVATTCPPNDMTNPRATARREPRADVCSLWPSSRNPFVRILTMCAERHRRSKAARPPEPRGTRFGSLGRPRRAMSGSRRRHKLRTSGQMNCCTVSCTITDTGG